MRNAFLALADLEDSKTSCATTSRKKGRKKKKKGANANGSTVTTETNQHSTEPESLKPAGLEGAGGKVPAPLQTPAQDHKIKIAAGEDKTSANKGMDEKNRKTEPSPVKFAAKIGVAVLVKRSYLGLYLPGRGGVRGRVLITVKHNCVDTRV
jgi:hypothetical protein